MARRIGIAASTGVAVWALVGALSPTARANPPCYARDGHLYCGNTAPTGIYEKPAFGIHSVEVLYEGDFASNQTVVITRALM